MVTSPPGRGAVATVVTALLLLAAGVLGAAGVASAQSSTIYVDSGANDPRCPEDDYADIQAAVDNAAAGDTIVVCSGFYREEVVVDKPLTIEVPSGSMAVLSGVTLGADPTAITVERTAAGTTIEGLEVIEYGTGVTVSANDTVVRDVLVNTTDLGVEVSASGTGTVSNVTLRGSTIDEVTTGVAVRSADSARLSDVVVFRNLINGSDVGVRVDGASSNPLAGVGIRQNLVANSGTAGISVTGGTDATGVRATRNFFRDNALGVDNSGDGTLTGWLNQWGDDSGPGSASGTVVDPETGAAADGDGDPVSTDVNFDPWLGKGACTVPQLRNVTDRTLELRWTNPYQGKSPSFPLTEEVRLSQVQPACLWERAALPFRADDDDAATSVRNLQLFVRTTSAGDVPANRPRLSVYQQGRSFELAFEPAAGADVSRFAGAETQLLVVRGEETSTDFEFGFDNETGEGRLRVDAASVSVVDSPALDGDGELTTAFTPASGGDYTFVLLVNDFGPGVSVGDSTEVRVDGGISVVGVESVPVQNANASASTVDPSYPAGSNVTFLLDSNLRDDGTNHSVILYNESRFADQRVTVEADGDVSEALDGDLSSGEVTIERSIRSVNGFIRADVGFSALGIEVAAQDRSGSVEAGPFVDVALGEFGIDGASETVTGDATQLNGSVVVVRSPDSDANVDVETFPNFSTGTYTYVYVAQQGSNVSSDTGTVELTTPTPTPTPTLPPGGTPTPTPTATQTATPTAAPGDGGDGGDGGGGGGGQPGGGGGGTVTVEDATLLNETVATGEPVVVRVNLANFDPARGRIALTLTADGEVATERTVSVGASSRRAVFVRTTFDEAGSFDVGLNDRDLGSVTVTARAGTPGGTPTRTPTPTVGATPTPTDAPGVTESPEATPTGTPGGTPTLPEGPDAPTGTEVVVTFVMVLSLLAAVGVVVYVIPAGVV